MAHLVYKKPLQEEKVRSKYITERRELKDSKNHLDLDTYKNAKKCMNDSFLLTSGLVESSSKASVRSSSISGNSIASSSSDSTLPTPVAKTRKGSIFDRGNVAARVFMADAQTEEQRETLKAQKKWEEQMKAAERLAELELAANGPFELPGSIPTSPDLDHGSKISSKTPRSRLFSFKRNRTGRSNPTSPDMVIQEGVTFDMAPISLPKPALGIQPILLRLPNSSFIGSTKSPSDTELGLISPTYPLDIWPHSPTMSPIIGPSAFMMSTPLSPELRGQRFTMSSGSSSAEAHSQHDSGSSFRFSYRPPNAKDEARQTWADRFLLGGGKTTGSRATIDQNYARSIVHGPSRRHSVDSGETGRSGRSDDSRRFLEARVKKCNTLSQRTSWATANELPYGLTNGYDDSEYVPPSTMLLELFVSLLREFDNTPKLFNYARRSGSRHTESSRTSSIISNLHPGIPVILDPELEDMQDLVKDRVWFLMTVKWQYFGRVLFSPGHHLLQLGKGGYGTSRPSTAEELRVLDLDGPLTADWSWHCALTYPDAQIHTLTTNLNHSLISPITTPFQPPPNQRRHQIPSLLDLSSVPGLPVAGFDLISSRNLPRFLKKSAWHTVFSQCHRLLKHDGYIELTIIDPVLNDMGPLTRRWILENVLHTDHPRTFDIMPTKTAVAALEKAGFREISKNWLWVPVTSVGDELSTVTSEMGRWWFDELYGGGGGEDEGIEGPRMHRVLEIWKDDEVMEECMARNSSFRWLKVWAKRMEGESGKLAE